jgi:hypothetical protein
VTHGPATALIVTVILVMVCAACLLAGVLIGLMLRAPIADDRDGVR